MKIRVRYFGYVFGIVLISMLLIWAGSVTWRDLRQLRESLSPSEWGATHRSDHIEASVNELNDIAMRFELDGDPRKRAAFDVKCQDLRQWIHANQTMLSESTELGLMDQNAGAFERYASLTAKLMDERVSGSVARDPTRILEQIQENAAPLFVACSKLDIAEGLVHQQSLEASHHALGWLQELLAVQMGLLLFFLGTAAVAVYRGLIGPLRVELVESRALAARNEKLASLGTLAAGVAHEIRNPLTAINVRLHSLKKNLIPNSSEQEDVLVIGHEIQRLERIVQEFLLFARPGEPKLLTISADSLLAKMQSLFGSQFEKASIRLNLESVPDIWVRVDPHQIEQVLINLIQNAAESMEHGGTITLRARSGKSRLNGSIRPIVMLEVGDTGTGIPPDVQNKIFEPFFTTKEEGTGLGLAVSARIIGKHGGTLECRSEVNRGTTFTIVLPPAKAEETDEI
jgi:signal transduction histidine kinase